MFVILYKDLHGMMLQRHITQISYWVTPRHFAWQAWHLSTIQPLFFCVAGVALHNFVTHTQLCHSLSFTHRTLSHTICHRHNCVRHYLSHTDSVFWKKLTCGVIRSFDVFGDKSRQLFGHSADMRKCAVKTHFTWQPHKAVVLYQMKQN